MIKKHRGIAMSDYIDILLNDETEEWDSCGFTDDGTYAFIFDDRGEVLISDECGIHTSLIADNTNIKKTDYKEIEDYLYDHTNGRVFTKNKSLSLRGYDVLTGKEVVKLIDAFKEKLGIDIYDYRYYIGDDDTRKLDDKNREMQDVYSITLKSYLILHKFTLDDIRNTFHKLENQPNSKVDRYDAFDVKDSHGRYMGVGRLGYHLLAYEEGKEYKCDTLLKFDDFIETKKERN